MLRFGFDPFGIRQLSLTALATALFVGETLSPARAVAEPASGSNGTRATASAPSKSNDSISDEDEDEDESAPKPTKSTAHTETTAVPESVVSDGVPPSPPKPGDENPRPYVAPPESVTHAKERHLTLSAVAGVWWHGLNGVGASTKAGPVWGASGRVEPYRWLGIRVTILRGNQSVTPNYGALGVPGVQIEQADFEFIHWSIRLEPTWNVTQRFALWAGPGLGWARAIVPEPKVGNLNWISEDRACVYVDAEFAVGGHYELLRDWITLNLELSGSSLGHQQGSAHEAVQAFTPDGHMTHIGAYPNFSHKVQGLFGIGVIL